MKIGILGGTFNPLHIGHLILAESIRTRLNLDRVIFIPCEAPPHKSRDGLVPAEFRVKMLRLALAANKKLSISTIEIGRSGPSFTVDTLRALSKKYPKDKLFLIIGSDLYKDFPKWRDPNKIKELAKVVVALRKEIVTKKEKSVMFVDIPVVDISSSLIRAMVKAGKGISYLVPKPVEDYIRKNRLYKKT